VRGLRRQQEVLDAGRALLAAAGQAGHAPYLRRGLERDRQLDRHAVARLPEDQVGADTRAKYVWFQCADKDGYNSPLDMASALHPQTQMTFKFADEILPRAYGFPMKIRVPTKLGFKNPKYVISMEVTNDYKGGFWEDQGYNSFSGS
jgi:DMSO/TMAO reductase YedYZ molybdopterin-dependent catalytic subunit